MIDDLFVTMCCGAKYKCQGRAKWICEDCKEDRSAEYVLMYDAMVKEDRKNIIKWIPKDEFLKIMEVNK